MGTLITLIIIGIIVYVIVVNQKKEQEKSVTSNPQNEVGTRTDVSNKSKPPIRKEISDSTTRFKFATTFQGDTDYARYLINPNPATRGIIQFDVVTYAVSFSPNEKYLATGGSDHVVYLYELPSLKISHKFQEHTNTIRQIVFSTDNRFIFSGSDDNTVRQWDVQSGKEVSVFQATDKIDSIALSPDGYYLIASNSYKSKTIWVWEVSSGKEMITLQHEGWDIILSPDGKYLLSLNRTSGSIEMWETSSWEKVKTFNFPDSCWSMAFSADRHYMAVGLSEEIVILDTSSMDVASWKKIMSLEGGEVLTFQGLSSHQATSYLAAGSSSNKTVEVWDISSWEKISVLEHTDRVRSISFSSKGNYLAVGGNELTLSVWEG